MTDTPLTIRLSPDLNARLDDYTRINPDLSKSGVATMALDQFLPKSASVGRAPPSAGQDAETGRNGRDFGMDAGRRLAERFGRLISPIAAEIEMPNGKKASLRTARDRNTQWGCLDTIRDRVDLIICAYTRDGSTYQIWEITTSAWRTIARPASAGHKLHGKLTLARKSDVERLGRRLPDVSL